MTQELIIKNMVCQRCIDVVKHIVTESGIEVIDATLGSVTIASEINVAEKSSLKHSLAERGFELLDDRKTQLINQMKSIIIDAIHYTEEPARVNFSTLLTEKLHYDYAYLSRLFSSVEGRTIEKFVLAQKVERVKELLTYDQKTLSEIAFEMGYSSAAHLSAQFKKVTGMTPSDFRKMQTQNRQFLDEV